MRVDQSSRFSLLYVCVGFFRSVLSCLATDNADLLTHSIVCVCVLSFNGFALGCCKMAAKQVSFGYLACQWQECVYCQY